MPVWTSPRPFLRLLAMMAASAHAIAVTMARPACA
jgi:hypothetical protein